MPDDHYHLEFHRAMEAAYERQAHLKAILVHEDDHTKFHRLCVRYNTTPELLFHSLLSDA